jgi:hypothetical protein
VADSYWCIPVRLDHDYGPLDLKRFERLRSKGTGLVK